MTSKRKSLVALLGVLILGVVGWYAWLSGTSHGEGVVESHEHLHVHGQGIDHGHEHEGAKGELAHSHPHQHDRHHHGVIEFPDQPGLTEIGHSHDASSETTHYWAKLVQEDGKLLLEFFSSQESQLDTSAPKAASLTAQIYNGSKSEGEVKFEKSGDQFVADLPVGFLVLPTYVFRIEDLEFGDLKTDALLPVTK